MVRFICPNCKEELIENNNILECKNRHCFDIAKEGYTNLLLANKKNSQFPGDNKQMVLAREEFLKKDFYKPLANTLSKCVIERDKKSGYILDAGCGVGYYSQSIANTIENRTNIYGIDISKFAIQKAAKKNQRLNFAVASIFDLPFKDKTFDVILNVFSPKSYKEFNRVLKDDGLLLEVMAGEKHLWELKEVLYKDSVRENVPDFEYGDFKLDKKENIKYKIHIDSNIDLENLLTMTPYRYKTSEADIKALSSVDILDVTIDFIIACWKK